MKIHKFLQLATLLLSLSQVSLNSSEQLTLRSQPVPLQNPDGRCVRNAMLQAFAPIIIDVFNTHAERTGTLLNDQQLIAMINDNSSSITRSELSAISLMRSVLAANPWSNTGVIGTYPFNSITICHYNEGAVQYPLLAHDITEGIHKITAANITYCQLPADRHLFESFPLDEYIAQQISAHTVHPDFLIVDAGSSELSHFDKYPTMGSNRLLLVSKPLPAAISTSNTDGTQDAYELVSFCNYERSGIQITPTILSRISSFIQWSAYNGINGIAHPYLLPTRHATAVVRYGDNWFVADDTRIWQVSAPEQSPAQIGQALLSQYPGMQALVMYKKVISGESQEAVNTEKIDLILTKVSADSNTPFNEQPITSAIAILLLIALAIGTTFATYILWGKTEHLPRLQRRLLRYLLIVMWGNTAFPYCGKALEFFSNFSKVSKAAAHSLKLSATDAHMSGLYSEPTPIGDSKTGTSAR